MTAEPGPDLEPAGPDYAPPPIRRTLARSAAVLVLLVALAYGAHLLMDWVHAETELLSPGMGAMIRYGVLAGILVAYAVLIAIPYVPGIEIGISLLLMRGAEVAPFVYVATVAGLLLAFAAGRALPHGWLRRLLLDFRLTRACRLLDTIQPLGPDERVVLLRARLPRWLGNLALGWRYVLVAVLINMPGSGLIGGGGGIAMVAGLTRIFRPRTTVLTFALAVLPFPLLVWLYGPGIFSGR